MVVNQSEIINNVLQSKGILSDKTLLSNHPWVLDADEELKQIEEDTERDLIELQEQEEMQTSIQQTTDGSEGEINEE